MSYIKADKILPYDIIKMVQEYVDGKSIYIPKKSEQRLEWGNNTGIREELDERNQRIYRAYCHGLSTRELADEFCLSIKSIQRKSRINKVKGESEYEI